MLVLLGVANESAHAGPIITWTWADETPNHAMLLLIQCLQFRGGRDPQPGVEAPARMPVTVGVGLDDDGLVGPDEDRGVGAPSGTLLLEKRLGSVRELAPSDEGLMHQLQEPTLFHQDFAARDDGVGDHPALVAEGLDVGVIGVLARGAAVPIEPLEGPAPVEARRAGDSTDQFLAFWTLALLGPPILALAGIGSAELWFGLSVRLWLLGAAVLALLILANSQGIAALWYAMAEFLTPIMLLGGLGSGFAGLFAWKLTAGTSGPAAKGSP